MYPANIEDHDPFLQNKKHIETVIRCIQIDMIPRIYYTMVEMESLISDKDLLKLNKLYSF